MKKLFLMALLVLPLVVITSCKNDDEGSSTPIEVSKTYALGSVTNPSISGTAKFIKNTDNSTTVELQLTGTTSGGMHPAHIHFNTAAESGGVAVTLGTVDGDTGFSSVTFSALNDATTVTYEDLLDFDGYINVHASATDLGTLVAQGDIGKNELTGNSTIYSIGEVASSGISGIATFYERLDGNTLVVLDVDGTVDGTDHITHIHSGSIASPGGIAITLTNVNGLSGTSKTSVSSLDDLLMINYSGLLTYEGYINIHASTTDLSVVANANIGSN